VTPFPATDLTDEHRGLVTEILRQHLPAASRVWVVGSRATGRARRYSDLDLAIDAGQRLTLDQFAILREAFEESDLPFAVDLIDWAAAGERFRSLSAGERCPLIAPQHPPDPGRPR
jgi:type I restriction enzyme S subunit